MKIEVDEIDELIRESSGRKLEILIQLKILNQKAFFHMKQFKKSWKVKYREMWKQPFWKKARLLLKEYFTLENNGKLNCIECGKEISKTYVLHHEKDFYSLLNFFNPIYVNILCSSICHKRKHSK